MAAFADDAADADDGIADGGAIEDAAVGNDRVIDLANVGLGGGQKARARKDRRVHIEEIEAGQLGGDIEVGLEEVADGADVFPITLEDIGEDTILGAATGDRLRDDMFAEIVPLGVFEELDEHVAVEDVDAHGGEPVFLVALDVELGIPVRVEPETFEDLRVLGFLDKARDAALFIDLHDAKGVGVLAQDGHGGHSDVRISFDVLGEDAAEIHAIELVAAEDDHVFEIVIDEVDEVFANGVGGALIPRHIGWRLFRGEDFDEAAAEMIELVRLRDVAVKRRGIELGEEINAFEIGIDAIGDRDIDEAVFAGERHGGFGTLFGEREQPRPSAAAHDHRENIYRVRCRPFLSHTPNPFLSFIARELKPCHGWFPRMQWVKDIGTPPICSE